METAKYETGKFERRQVKYFANDISEYLNNQIMRKVRDVTSSNAFGHVSKTTEGKDLMLRQIILERLVDSLKS